MNDEEIVGLYWQRNESAIAETERKYGAYLTKIAYNILADAEDSRECVNDTYMRAWSSMPENRPSVLSAYLGKLARRLSIDRIRERGAEKRRASEYAVSLSELADTFSGGDTTESACEAARLGEAISSFLHGLPDEARNLFIIRYYYFDSVKAAAAACKMSEAKAKSMLFRTRQKLRDYLEREGFDI